MDDPEVLRRLARELIDKVLSGEITDRDSLQAEKMRMCGRYHLKDVPQNSFILSNLDESERVIKIYHLFFN